MGAKDLKEAAPTTPAETAISSICLYSTLHNGAKTDGGPLHYCHTDTNA